MAMETKIKNTKISVGDNISITQLIREGDKTRQQAFKGIVIAIKGKGETKTFTVRKIGVAGIGVERIWPVSSPWIEKVDVLQKGKARRAKLYYLRGKIGKAATKVK